MAVQVQMRGGTTEEHALFTGSFKEVTVDTTKKTLVVHDGVTLGGTPLATEQNLTNFQNTINDRLKEFENSVGKSHNHDDLYSKLDHNHDERYSRTPTGCKGMFLKQIGDYNGFAGSTGNDSSYIRTTKSGLLPYQNGSSNIGTSSWRFAGGYFNNVDTNNIKIDGGELKLANSASINFGNDDRLTFNDSTNEYQLSADGEISKARLCLGHIQLNGKRIYIGSSFPSDARVNDILIQV